MPIRNSSPTSWTDSPPPIQLSKPLALKPDTGISGMTSECCVAVQQLVQTLHKQNSGYGKNCVPNPILLAKAIQFALLVEPWNPFNFIHNFTVRGEVVAKGLKVSIETSDKARLILDYRVGASGHEEGAFGWAIGTERKMLAFGQHAKDGTIKEGFWTYSSQGHACATLYGAHGPEADPTQTARYRKALKERPCSVSKNF